MKKIQRHEALGARRQALEMSRSVTSAQRPATSDSPRGMTLIELMITVVILVTLIGAVLPLVSPNNDARKIAEAARGLQTYFMQAQAEAARTGRPVGVGFRETSPGSGVAIEAFQMVVPKPYPGSSSLSRVGVEPLPSADKDSFYSLDSVPPGSVSPGSDDLLFNQFVNAQIYAVTGRMAVRDGNGDLVSDPLPPGMFRVGDIIEAQGNRFVIVDDHRHISSDVTGLTFLNPAAQAPPFKNVLFCVRLDEIRLGNKVQPLGVPQSGYPYAIHRQPLGSDEIGGGGRRERIMASSEPVFQLPAGVCIDLQASGIEAGGGPEAFSEEWEGAAGRPYAKQIGLMFSPNGGIDGVWFNGDTVTSVFRSGNKIADLSRIFLLLGRVENQNPQFSSFDMDGQIVSDEQLRDVRSKVNWLNPDSRWLMITANEGRFTVSPNAMFDPTNTNVYSEVRDLGVTGNFLHEATKIAQIEAAHGLGHTH